MRTRLARWSRILRTGLAFAIYFSGGLVLGGMVLPLASLLGGDTRRAGLRSQRWIQRGYQLFVQVLEGLGLARIHFVGGERLGRPGPCLLVANHPSLLDSPILVSRLPQVDCVASESWSDHPTLKRAVRAAGYLRNDSGVEVVRAAAERLREGRTVLMFPEGTRSPRGGLHPFHRGAAHVALESGCDPIPVVILQDPPSLQKGDRWWQVPDRPMRYEIQIGDPLPVGDIVDAGATRSVAARQLTATLRELFEKRMHRGRV